MARFTVRANAPAPHFPEIARVVAEETRASRRRLHTVRGGLGCDAFFDLTNGFRVSGGCPCVDEYIDAVVQVWRYLTELDPFQVRSYGALARAHCRLRVIGDILRARRGTRTQQRTDRLADSAIGRALTTDEHRALLRHIVDEAASASPLDGDEQLLGRLAELRAREFGGTAADHVEAVARDLPLVRAAAVRHGRRRRDSAGELVTWWDFYVETGLGRRERLSSVSITSADDAVTAARDLADWNDRLQTWRDDTVIQTLLAAIRSVPQETLAVDAVRSALARLADHGELDAGIARRVLGDPQRLSRVVDALTELIENDVKVPQ